MVYSPPEDIFCRIWIANCGRSHVFYVYRPQNCGKIVISDFVLFRKKTTNPIFSRLHSLAVVESWKYGVCCFWDIFKVSLGPPVRIIYDKSQKWKIGGTKIKSVGSISKPFSFSFPTYQMIHNVEIERVRVPLIYYCPSSPILPVKCYYHQFFMPGVVTNSNMSEN